MTPAKLQSRVHFKNSDHAMFGRCSYPMIHGRHHHPHPAPYPGQEPRPVCFLCHPPAVALLELARDPEPLPLAA